MTVNRIRLASLLALTMLFTPLAGGAVALAAPVTAPAPAALHSATAQPVTPEEAAAYAARDRKANPELAKFEGGDVVLITASTLTVVLLIILVVILI